MQAHCPDIAGPMQADSLRSILCALFMCSCAWLSLALGKQRHTTSSRTMQPSFIGVASGVQECHVSVVMTYACHPALIIA